jgi:hypothetical protein
MSYEGDMLVKLAMPTRQEVENAIITTLFRHNGSIKEFTSGEDIVSEIADIFCLDQEQRETVLERIYRKENRIVKHLSGIDRFIVRRKGRKQISFSLCSRCPLWVNASFFRFGFAPTVLIVTG